jgi:hypothetical protein
MLYKNFLSLEDIDSVKKHFNSLIESNHPKIKTETWSNNSKTAFMVRAFDSLLSTYKQDVSEVVGRPLTPTYSFVRKSYRGGTLPYHFDRPVCEVSVTVNIETSNNCVWPFYLDHNSPTEYLMNVGDAVIYNGYELIHWRNPLEADFNTQLCLHYVYSDGPFALCNPTTDWSDIDKSHYLFAQMNNLNKQLKILLEAKN